MYIYMSCAPLTEVLIPLQVYGIKGFTELGLPGGCPVTARGAVVRAVGLLIIATIPTRDESMLVHK